MVPAANAEDSDDVVVALETARVSEERGDLIGAAKWLHRGAAAARKQARPERAGNLSRTAAQLSRAAGTFERKVDEPQVLSDIDDDEGDQTIVETPAEIKRRQRQSDRPKSRSKSKRASKAKVVAKAETASVASKLVVEKPTPVAALVEQPVAAAHQAVRVAVKKILGGKFEARPLSGGESPGAGEQEALLVPTQGGSKLP